MCEGFQIVVEFGGWSTKFFNELVTLTCTFESSRSPLRGLGIDKVTD